MATYAELFAQRSNSELRNKIAVAVAIAAHDLIVAASPTAAELTWAQSALAAPVAKADEILPFVLAANKDATVAQINSASDASIQTQVDNAVSKLTGAV